MNETLKSDIRVTPAERREASPEYLAHLRQIQNRRRLILFCQLLLFASFMAVWEIGPRLHWINPILTSFPSAIWSVLAVNFAESQIYHHAQVTLLETIIGFSTSMVCGILIAMILWWWGFLHRVLEPFMVVANALPKIALVPIFLIWLGAVGAIYAIAFTISIFITVIMIHAGFNETEADKITLLRAFGASKRQVLMKVVLPSSVPSIIAALKINVGLALIGVVAGEFQAAKEGLGFLIIYGSNLFAMDLVMASIVLLAVMSTLMYGGVLYLESKVTRHRA